MKIDHIIDPGEWRKWRVSSTGFAVSGGLPGANGTPNVGWSATGLNGILTTGPEVSASVNGTGRSQTVFLGTGGSLVDNDDVHLPLNGIDWHHQRIFSSKSSSSLAWQGEGWWGNEMMNIAVDGAEGASDCHVEFDPHYTFDFTYSGGSWTCDDNYPLTLTFSSGNNEYIMTRVDGFVWVFHDAAATDAGKLKRIEDPYDNDWAFTYSSGQLTDIVVDVVAGNDHKITYSYFTSGDNNGLLQYVKVYKTTTTTDANLIAKAEYVYHDSSTDAYGIEDDLLKAIITRKGTSDGDGVLSIEETYYYRYYKGTYDAGTNPGTDHQLRYVLLPENADRLGVPESKTNAQWDSYANVVYEYDSNGRVRQTDERLPGSAGCGCSGGGDQGTTTFAWSVNGGAPDLDTWNIHCVADRQDNTRVIFDVNYEYQFLTWVVQDEDDGTPTKELIWHWDYGTSGDTENRMTAAYNPSACTAYDESSPYGATLSSTAGLIRTIEYDTGNYAGYPKKIRVKQGTSGTADTLIQYARSMRNRPDLATTVTEYESGSEADGRATTIAYTFYDSAGAKQQISQIDVTYPLVSTAKNGPNVSAVTKYFYDKRTGALRWSLDGEGYVKFYAYDDETGVSDLGVQDANTSTLMTVIDDNWDGVTHGGLAADDTVPFSRTGGGTALNIDSSSTIDWLGRTRKSTDAEGMITYYVYKDDETRVYPAWQTGTELTLLPIRITKTDKDGRPEETVTLDNTFDPNVTTNEPNGTTTYANSDMATRTVHTYNVAGQRSDTDRYHTIPASGNGTRYTDYYRTTSEYDDMGRLEYSIEDVADESSYDREQVTQYAYDFLGRRITVSQGVSDNTHDISAGKPTMRTTMKYFYDSATAGSQGEGDGNLTWARKYHGTGASDYNDTEYRYDWRNRRQLTIPPLAPYTLVKHDNLDRVTASGQYSATTNLDPGDDPATTENGNRLDLSKKYYDEWGRVYKRETFQDPADATPADALTSNTYYDRRRLVVASDPHTRGVTETKYDGAGRRTEVRRATALEAVKYASGAFDYLDDDDKIVAVTEYTLDETGRAQKTIRKAINHDDTDGLDLTNNDDYIRTYVYSWYDGAHRLIDTANYGTNNANGWKDNSTAPTYGASAPSRSDTVLVTTHAYHADGWRNKVTDPKNVATLSLFDRLGRVTEKQEADATADERITKYAYNGQNSLTKITADLTTDQETEYVYADAVNARWVTKIRYPNPSTGVASDLAADTIEMTYNVDGTIATRTDQNASVLTWDRDTLRRKTEVEVSTVGTGVDSTVRALTWTYNSDGLVEYVSSHSDITPDISTWTDAIDQIKYTYDAGNFLTKMEMDHDSKVGDNTGVDTRDIQFTYGTDFSTGNYKRVNYVTYPSGRKLWNGYTHSDTAGTFQDTINDKFSRVGQLANDSSGSIGDIIAQYDFNGMGRFVRRDQKDASGWSGNDTKVDLWHDTSGDYDGLDRFGRIVDIKHVDYSGTATDFDRFKYSYDRAGNRTKRDNIVYAARGQAFTYNNLYQLTQADQGILDANGNVLLASKIQHAYDMDVLGNLNQTNGLKVNNGAAASVKHTTNATNEITQIDRANQGGAAKAIVDDFASAISSAWTAEKGTWNISSAQANVATLTSSQAVLVANATLDDGAIEVKVTIPTAGGKAGVVFSHDGNNNYYAVLLDETADTIGFYQVSKGAIPSPAQSASVTITTGTQYTVKVFRRQRRVYAEVSSVSFTHDVSTDLGQGTVGLYADKIGTKFDDFSFSRMDGNVSKCPRWRGSASASVVSGYLEVNGGTRGGVVFLEGFTDDDYMVKYIGKRNGGDAILLLRYVDHNNHYRVIDRGSSVDLERIENGNVTSVTGTAASTAMENTIKVKLSGSTIKVWYNGVLLINDTSNSKFLAGGFGLGGPQPKINSIKIGYDNNADDDIDDAGDDIVYNGTFSGTSTTVTHDDNGNLTDDGTFQYEYDAWNRLVTVKTQEDNLTVAVYKYDALGRRIKKTVTNSGDLDGTTYFYYNKRWQMLESRDGSENLDTQVIYGTQYVDEIVRFEKQDYGTMFVFQDANWNVTSTVNYDAAVLDRLHTTPYGQPTFDAYTLNGDYDADGDLDATDDSNLTTCKNGTQPVTGACRVFDFDNDGDVDTADETRFDELYPGSAVITRQPARQTSANGFIFAHQGLMLDAETMTYQNRHRQYNPWQKRFMQRDPMGLMDEIADTMPQRRIRYASMIAPLLGEWRLPPQAPRQYAGGMNVYGRVKANPTSVVDPSGLCPPSPGCVPGPCGTAGCGMYLPWHPAYYVACMAGGNGPWANCVRACLQQCICASNVCIRWGAAVQAGCHLGCWSGC